MSEGTAIAGEVYVERSSLTLGMGDTGKKSNTEIYWVAEPRPDNSVELRLLDMDDEPTGVVERISNGEFQRRFVHQPDYFTTKKSPMEQLVDKIVGIADEHLRGEELDPAEYEYQRALNLDEESVRANFGLGMTYLAQDRTTEAAEMFLKLASLEGTYKPRHKHIFNEFGIQLRKVGMRREALEHYHQALKIVKNDDHLWFNMGRALYDEGMKEGACKAMIMALKLNPELTLAQRFVDEFLSEEAEKIGQDANGANGGEASQA